MIKIVFYSIILTFFANVFANSKLEKCPIEGLIWNDCKQEIWLANKNLTGLTMKRSELIGWKVLDGRSSVGNTVFSNRVSRANFERTRLIGFLAWADFTGAVFIGSRIGKDQNGYITEVYKSNFTNANFSYVDWSNVFGHEAIFNEADISHAHFTSADLSYSDFRDLTSGYKVDFSKAILYKTNFSSTKEAKNNLVGAVFTQAKLQDAIFENADLRDANFRDAEIDTTKFDNSDLSGAIWKNGQKCTGGSIGKCNLPNEFPQNPSTYRTMPYRGINLPGAEFGHEFQLPSLKDGLFYAANGMNTIRLPFKWEYLQSNSTDLKHREKNPSVAIDYNNPKAKAFLNLVNDFRSKNMTVILDMHNYMRYDGTGPVHGKVIGSGVQGAPTVEQYANAWVQIASHPSIKNNRFVLLNLMNEPNSGEHGNELTTERVLEIYNVVIKKLRGHGINNLVLLDGNGFSGAFSWTQNWYGTPNNLVFTPDNIKDPVNNYAINVHHYFDASHSGTERVCRPTLHDISGLNAYLEKYKNERHPIKATITEIGAPNNMTCANLINQFLNELPEQHYLGWTAWAGGEKATVGTISINYVGLLPGNMITQNMTYGFGKHLRDPFGK